MWCIRKWVYKHGFRPPADSPFFSDKLDALYAKYDAKHYNQRPGTVHYNGLKPILEEES